MAKEGKDTTEFQEVQKSNWITVLGMVMSAIIMYAPKVLQLAPENAKWGIIGGAVLAVVTTVYKALVSLGYLKSRTDIKVTEAAARAAEQPADAG